MVYDDSKDFDGLIISLRLLQKNLEVENGKAKVMHE